MNKNTLSTAFLILGIIINVVYAIVVIYALFTNTYFNLLKEEWVACDFKVFYNSSVIFYDSPQTLYIDPRYPNFYRYIPTFAMLFFWFRFLTLEQAFFSMVSINLVSNLLSCYVILKYYSKSADSKKSNEWVVKLLLFSYLFSPSQLQNFSLGQTSSIIGFLLVFCIYISKTQEQSHKVSDFIIGLLLGVLITLKPILIALLPFFLAFKKGFNKKQTQNIFLSIKQIDWNKLFIRFAGLFVVLSPNLFLLFRYPNYLPEFLSNNTQQDPSIHSMSFSKFLMDFVFGADNLLFIIFWVALLILLLGISFLFFWKGGEHSSVALFSGLSLLSVFSVYSDIWPHYLLLLAPVLILVWIEIRETAKFINIELALNVALNCILFTWPVGILIYLQTLVDPFSAPLFLIMLFLLGKYTYSSYLRNKERIEQAQNKYMVSLAEKN